MKLLPPIETHSETARLLLLRQWLMTLCNAKHVYLKICVYEDIVTCSILSQSSIYYLCFSFFYEKEIVCPKAQGALLAHFSLTFSVTLGMYCPKDSMCAGVVVAVTRKGDNVDVLYAPALIGVSIMKQSTSILALNVQQSIHPKTCM